MEMEGLNFPEAIKRVAEMNGIALPEPDKRRAVREDQKAKRRKKTACRSDHRAEQFRP